MTRRRSPRPETISIDRVAAEFAEGFAWFTLCGAARPTKARVWRRHDGGITVRAAGVTPEGRRVSYTVKVSEGLIVAWPFAPLTPNRYGVILVDPPWPYAMRSEAGYAKSPEHHYDTMPLDRIAALPVAKLAGPNCLLVLWSTWPHLSYAMEIMRVWGFEYKTGGSWTKKTLSGKTTFGTGFIFRTASEPYLVGTVGSPGIYSRSERNVIETEDVESDFPAAIHAVRRQHSRKPAEMREIVQRLCPWARCVDLFGRESWPGHDVWGGESSRFDGVEP